MEHFDQKGYCHHRDDAGNLGVILLCVWDLYDVTYGLMFPLRSITQLNGMSLWAPTDGACVAPQLNWAVMVKAGTWRDVDLKFSFQCHPLLICP